jgi:phospholipase/lecithinase/hemolysin
MRKFIAAGLLAVASFGVTPVQASSLNFFTSFWAFGDSLSDPGNLSAALEPVGIDFPPAPYFEGQFSNGPVWSDYIAKDFEKAGLATGNYAYGFAKALPSPGVPPPLPPFVLDLPQQIQQFAAEDPGKLGQRPVASLLFGPNDIGYGGVQTGTPEGVVAVATGAANAVADGVLTLKGLGIKDVLLFYIPPLDLIPGFALLPEPPNPGLSQLAGLGSVTFNAALHGRIPGLVDAGINVMTVDLYGLFLALVDDPTQFGVLDAKHPCFTLLPELGGPGFLPYCSPEKAPLFAFWDQSHPNSVIHEQIAGIVKQQVAPVPLPVTALLLVGGIAGLGLMRRRAA